MKTKLVMLVMLAALINACSKDDGPTKPDAKDQTDSELQNKAPIASAGENRQEEIGATVKLDASASTDPDGDDISYHWTFKEIPSESITVIVGVGTQQAEFEMDKAGTYLAEVEISDGELKSSASVMIVNKAPFMENVDPIVMLSDNNNTYYLNDKNLVQSGNDLRINGRFFSLDDSENAVALAGEPCEITSASATSLWVRLPDDAVGGELVVTVGTQSTSWPNSLREIGFPIDEFILASNNLEEQVRSADQGYDPDSYFEIGTRFRPLEDGKVHGFTLRMPQSTFYVVTLWDSATGLPLASETMFAERYRDYLFELSESISIERNKEYIVSVNSNNWFRFIDEQDGQKNQFPGSFSNVEILSTAYKSGDNQVFPDEGFPINYILDGPDVMFTPDQH
jgi:hypothetical protein